MTTDGNKIFVGREAELELFRQMLKDPYGDKHILLLLGGGGIGKTKLVRQMLFENQNIEVLIPREPIDLFSTDYRHIDGIQWKVKEVIEDLTGLRGISSPFAGWVKGKTDTSEKFYECLKAFCAKCPLVLAFDTLENLDKVASDWLFKGGSDGLQVPGLICIVAGRDKEIEDIETYQNNSLVLEKKISGFTVKEADDFFLEITKKEDWGLDDLLKDAEVTRDNSFENSIEWVKEITEGHPLRLEMVFRWLGTMLKDDSLEGLKASEFEKRLMLQVSNLAERGLLDAGAGKQVSQPVFETLLCMSHITRRFDEEFLQHFIDQKLIRLDDSSVTKRDIIDNLERYFFVKVHQGPYVLQLHDEMARLVREHVWPYWDPSSEKKQALLDAVVKYYDQLISDSIGEEANV